MHTCATLFVSFAHLLFVFIKDNSDTICLIYTFIYKGKKEGRERGEGRKRETEGREEESKERWKRGTKKRFG